MQSFRRGSVQAAFLPVNQLTFFALEAQTAALRLALSQSRKAAVNVTNPLTMHSMLFKGTVASIAEPSDAARDAVNQHLGGFVDALRSIGFPDFTLGFNHAGPARRIVVSVERHLGSLPVPLWPLCPRGSTFVTSALRASVTPAPSNGAWGYR